MRGIIVGPVQLIAPTVGDGGNPVFAVLGLEFTLDEWLQALPQQIHRFADALVIRDCHSNSNDHRVMPNKHIADMFNTQ